MDVYFWYKQKYVYFATMIDVYICCQVAEEECGSAAVADMETEPYFVDFLREAPEPTGIFPSSFTTHWLSCGLYILIYNIVFIWH